ncbi:MAG: hypothetical protein JWM33_1084 [Caulobacteraceae bacterium]|nr:hypothetical protein [Caulobacteraceae bacterium]
MAETTLMLIGAVGALAAGSAAAQICGPLASDWKAKKGTLQSRLLGLCVELPGPGRRAIGAFMLVATLSGGALAAYAAEPGAPERLATQAAGVVGSGDQLSLKLKTPQGERTLKVGEAYADGWTLRALTPTKATLDKDGTTREIGLNPTGALASTAPPDAPVSVSVVARERNDGLPRCNPLDVLTWPKEIRDTLPDGGVLLARGSVPGAVNGPPGVCDAAL